MISDIKAWNSPYWSMSSLKVALEEALECNFMSDLCSIALATELPRFLAILGTGPSDYLTAT
jgi:hypothetical protein